MLKGGSSAEREVSLVSGEAVYQGLRRLGAEVEAIDVDDDIVDRLRTAAPDLVVIMLHGKVGEDGVIQGLLEVLGLPYTGSGVLASALAMDKIRSKLLWERIGLNTARFAELFPDTDWQAVIDELGKVVVKPVNGGSSLGVFLANDATELREIYAKAASYDDQVMAEEFILGRELSRGVLGESMFPTIEVRSQKELFDFDAKYKDADTEIVVHPTLSPQEAEQVEHISRTAYDALGCKGLARVDFMQDREGEFYLLELNTIPGMTEHSFVPASAKGIGIDFDTLLLHILDEELRQLER